MINLTRTQIAELRGCTPTTVSRARLPQTDGKKYDLLDPEVRAFVAVPDIERAERERQRTSKASPEDMNIAELEAQKLREEIEYKRRMTMKIELQVATQKKALIPTDIARIWVGHFSSGLRNNFLEIGNRIARGDTKLRDKIEKELKKAIEKTIDVAEKATKAN